MVKRRWQTTQASTQNPPKQNKKRDGIKQLYMPPYFFIWKLYKQSIEAT
jgi:hypothetical protein